jgi:mRNA interferase RelE/StbE
VYKIIFAKQAVKSLQKMPHKTAVLIWERLTQIAGDPFATHPNVTKLQGRPGYRLRVGDWRVIYEIKNDELVILVLKIATRGEVYR